MNVPSLFKHRGWNVSICAACIVAIGVLWSFRYNQPLRGTIYQKGILKYDKSLVTVSVDCDGPQAVVVSQVGDYNCRVTFFVQPGGILKPDLPERDVWVNCSSAGAEVTGLDRAIGGSLLGKLGAVISLEPPSPTPFGIRVIPRQPGSVQVDFTFYTDPPNPGGNNIPLGVTTVVVPSREPWLQFILPYAISLVAFGITIFTYWWVDSRQKRLRAQAERKIAEATEQANQNPARARLAWDLASVKLEAYFDRNLIQVNLVFWVAVFVMMVGFGFVLAGVAMAYKQPIITPSKNVAAIAGIITQFIGASFMVIYRSTMAQANNFTTILERINTVGMAVQVMEALHDDNALKDTTRAQMAVLLLRAQPPSAAQMPKGTIPLKSE